MSLKKNHIINFGAEISWSTTSEIKLKLSDQIDVNWSSVIKVKMSQILMTY